MKFRQVFIMTMILSCIIFFGGCSKEQIISHEEKGDRAFEENSYRLAVQYWMESIENTSDKYRQCGLYHKIGKTWLKLSRIDLAEKYFEEAVKINPKEYEIQKDLVQIFLLQGKNNAALRKLELLKYEFEKDADFYSLYGDVFMLLKNFLEAEKMYRNAVLQDPGNIRIAIKLAMCLYQADNGDEAETLIAGIQKKQALASNDLLLLSDYYLLVQDFSRAEDFIVKALENDPDNIMLKIRLCQFYLQTDMRDKAKKSLVEFEGEYPQGARFKLMLADIFLSELDMDNADVVLKKIKNIKEVQSDYNLLMGKLWLFKGKNSHAIFHLKSVIDIRPGILSARYLLGIAYFAAGQTKLAEKSFINVLILNPDHVETLVALAGLHYKNREYKLADQYLEKAISLSPSNVRALMLKGLCLMEQKKAKKASQEFTKVHFLIKDAPSLFFLGKSLESQGKFDTALDLYKDLIDQKPELMDVLYKYTALLVEMGQGKKAGEIVEKIIERGYGHSGVYYVGARVRLELEDYDAARKYLDKAMEAENVPGYIYGLAAEMYRKTGEYRKEEDVLRVCMEKNPGYAKAWINLAGLYFRSQRKTQALEILNQAVKKIPDNVLIAGNLAWLLLEEKKDFDRALDLARTAYEKFPGKVYLMDTLGWAYYHKRIFSQAEWLLTEAEELEPDEGIIKYHLGMVLYKQGKLSEAKEKLKRALEYELLDEDMTQAEQALADLETGKGENVFKGEIKFDPEAPLAFPGISRDDEDILEPDWSRILKKADGQ